MVQELTAERIERGFQTILADSYIRQVEVEKDVAMRATLVRAIRTDFARVIWTATVGEAPVGRWDAFRHSLPRWTWHMLGRPKYQSVETKLYHACPHLAADPQAEHLRWLAMERGE